MLPSPLGLIPDAIIPLARRSRGYEMILLSRLAALSEVRSFPHHEESDEASIEAEFRARVL